MFTAGPWRVGQDTRLPGHTIIKETAVNRGRHIAQLDCHDEESQSNAALIALAPEMYELILRIHDRLMNRTTGARARNGGSVGTVLAEELHRFANHIAERVRLYEYERDHNTEG
jgi:hypothetical protein